MRDIERFWEPGDPPGLEGLKDWCSDQVKTAVMGAVDSIQIWTQVDGGELFIRAVTDIEFTNAEGNRECLSKAVSFASLVDDRFCDLEELEDALVAALATVRSAMDADEP